MSKYFNKNKYEIEIAFEKLDCLWNYEHAQ